MRRSHGAPGAPNDLVVRNSHGHAKLLVKWCPGRIRTYGVRPGALANGLLAGLTGGQYVWEWTVC
jgi:hypothetical protein